MDTYATGTTTDDTAIEETDRLIASDKGRRDRLSWPNIRSAGW